MPTENTVKQIQSQIDCLVGEAQKLFQEQNRILAKKKKQNDNELTRFQMDFRENLQNILTQIELNGMKAHRDGLQVDYLTNLHGVVLHDLYHMKQRVSQYYSDIDAQYQDDCSHRDPRYTGIPPHADTAPTSSWSTWFTSLPRRFFESFGSLMKGFQDFFKGLWTLLFGERESSTSQNDPDSFASSGDARPSSYFSTPSSSYESYGPGPFGGRQPTSPSQSSSGRESSRSRASGRRCVNGVLYQ